MRLPWRPVVIAGVTVQTSLTAREAARLQELATGRHVLEIGSAFGYSAIAMAQTAEDVTLVDPFEQYSRSELRANLQAAGTLARTRIITGESQGVLPALRQRGERFGLIFIDGDHSRDTVRADLDNALALLDAGGVLCAHDYGEDTCPGVRQAIDAQHASRRHRLTDTLWETW